MSNKTSHSRKISVRRRTGTEKTLKIFFSQQIEFNPSEDIHDVSADIPENKEGEIDNVK